MKKLIQKLLLPKEAILLDSWLYILKSMPALGLAYVIGISVPQLQLDMISLMLGVMYNLEPINKIGFKSAKDQMMTSALGGLITGLLIIGMGYHITVWTVSIGIGLTIYVSLLVDYRFVSPAALFTSIYMTQLLRLNAQGQPDVWITLGVRLVSLGLGILVAMIFNVGFSKLYYRNLIHKRLEFVKEKVVESLEATRAVYRQSAPTSGQSSILAFAFNDIEMVKANIESILLEQAKSMKHDKVLELNHELQRLIALKNILHLAYDGLYRWENGESKPSADGLMVLDKVISGLKEIDYVSLRWPEGMEIDVPTSLKGDFSRSAVNFKWMAMHFEELA